MPLDDLDIVEDAGKGIFKSIAWIFRGLWSVIAWFSLDIVWASLEWLFDRKGKRKNK